MNKLYTIFYLLLLQCPAFCYAGHVFLRISKNHSAKATPFQHALAELYVHNPELLHHPQEIEIQEEWSFGTKNSATQAATIIPFIYFCYQSYANYKNYTHRVHTTEKSFVNQTINTLFPKLFVNAPGHVRFFLEEVEILLQAYLFKLLLKMIIFCFL